MKPLKKNISLSLDPDVIERIRVLADNEDRSLSQCINIILRQWLQCHKTDALKQAEEQ